MQNKNAFLLLFMIYLFGCLSTTKTNQNLATTNDKACLKDFLKLFIENPLSKDTDYSAIIADDDVKQICPNLETTCCTSENLDQISLNFYKGILKFEEIKNKLHYLMVRADSAGYENLLEHKDERFNTCIGSSNLQEITKRVESSFQNKALFFEKLTTLSDAVFDSYKGFGCEICNPKTSLYVSQNGKMIQYNAYNVHNIFKSVYDLLSFLKNYLQPFMDISNYLQCYSDKTAKTTETIALGALDKRVSDIIFCMQELNKSVEQFNSNFNSKCPVVLDLIGNFQRLKFTSLIMDIIKEIENKISASIAVILSQHAQQPAVYKEVLKKNVEKMEIPLYLYEGTKTNDFLLNINVVQEGGIMSMNNEMQLPYVLDSIQSFLDQESFIENNRQSNQLSNQEQFQRISWKMPEPIDIKKKPQELKRNDNGTTPEGINNMFIGAITAAFLMFF